MKKIIPILFIFLTTLVSTAQKITLSGTIFSFKSDKVMLLKKASKNVSFDGSLSGVSLKLTGENSNASVVTGLNGGFYLSMETPGKYKLEISKSGYSTLSVDINYIGEGNKSRFESLFFILKQEDNSNVQLGTLEIDKGVIGFAANTGGKSSDILESNAHLMEKAISINASGGGGPVVVSNDKQPEKKNPEKTNDKKTELTEEEKTGTNQPAVTTMLMNYLDDSNTDSLKFRLAEARKILSEMTPGTAEYNQLKQQIVAAEQKIKDHEAIIAYQEKEISQANQIILYISLFAVFALISAGVLFYFFKEKKRYAAILKEKNANIVKINTRLLSSIRYASLIQSNFMQEKKNLRKLFPESFVFNSPKDILSGDFYWFSHTNNHRIAVVADCTGHGVPGAMLTVLGHNVLNEIINIQGETSPAKILLGLNKALLQTFSSSNHHLEYGMDISIISIKDNSNELLLSGINNGIYRSRGNEVKYFPVSSKPLGAELTATDVTDQRIDIEKNDSFFLFSDGYVDQFSADEKKVVKFNVGRFEKLLTDISSKSFNDSETVLEKTLQEWKGQRDQIDDICIMGVKI